MNLFTWITATCVCDLVLVLDLLVITPCVQLPYIAPTYSFDSNTLLTHLKY